MKKLIMFLLVAGTCTTAVVAQDSAKAATTNKMGKMHQMKDCLIMKEGKMIVINSNGLMPMDKLITLTNGTIVSADGTVKATDGTSIKLKEGEAVDMDGKLITPKEMTKKEN